MPEFTDICLKHVRSLKLRPNWRIFIRHDWERFLKPGWERSMPPGSSVAADMYYQLKAEKGRKWQVRASEPTREEIATEKAAYEEYQTKLAELRWMLADLKLDPTLQRFREKANKANFNPSQPRWPKGSGEDSGRWSGDSGIGTAGAGHNSGAPTRGGHHFVPRKLFEKEPLRPETLKVFEEAVTGPLNAGPHRRDKDHDIYSDAVIERYRRFLDENRTRSEELTPDQARKFVDEVKRSSDPRIRGLNLRIYMREIMYWLRRGPRSE